MVAVVLGLTAVVGACGGTGSNSSTKPTSPTGSATSGGTPLEQLFGSMGPNRRAIEDQVAACMRGRGWEYTPNPAAFATAVSVGGTSDPKFREQYGYGISTQPPVEAFTDSPGSGAVKDPNQAYVDGLNEADRIRYQNDLFGSMDDMAKTAGARSGGVSAARGPDENSCFAWAQANVAKDHPEMGEEFGRRLGELMQAVDSNPKMAAATAKWSACMASAKFTYAKPDDILADLQQRANPLFGIQNGAPSPDGSGVGAMIIAGGAMPGSGPTTTLSKDDQDRLAKLQAEERAIAKADARCRVDTVDKARPALEQEVVDKLRSEFPGLGGGK